MLFMDIFFFGIDGLWVIVGLATIDAV